MASILKEHLVSADFVDAAVERKPKWKVTSFLAVLPINTI